MITDLTLRRGMPVAVQGADFAACRRWIAIMRRYGTNVAACITTADSPDGAADIPLFRCHADARAATHAEVCVSVAPPRSAADAALEAAESGFRMVLSLSAGVPIHDMMRAQRRVRDLGVTWIGAASSGLARPAEGVMLGGVPVASLRPGDVAVVTTCGGLGAEAGIQMADAGLGQSLYIDLGADPVKATRMAALPAALKADPATRAIVLLGAIGGTEEDEFSAEIQRISIGKPVLAYIAGQVLADGSSAGTAAARKAAALAGAGATVYNSLGALVAALKASA